MSSTKLFQRRWKASIGDLSTDKLRIAFRVTKSLEKEPNSLELKITNLSEASRGKLKGAGVACVLEAGYEGSRAVIFSGNSRTIDHAREGSDWTTIARCGDGEQAFQYARINQKFAPGSKLADVIRAAANALTLNKGNLEDALTGTLAFQEFSHGFVGFGRAGDVFDKLIRSAGLTWSVQQGAIQVVKRGEPFLQKKAALLTATSGLIGSPVHAPPDKKGKPSVLKCKCLLNPQIIPGRIISLDTRSISGEFVAQKVEHQGDSHGNDWHTIIEALARKV